MVCKSLISTAFCAFFFLRNISISFQIKETLENFTTASGLQSDTDFVTYNETNVVENATASELERLNTESELVSAGSSEETHNINEVFENEKPPWFKDALKDIAYYLRAHKFNEFDRRYNRHGDNVQRYFSIISTLISSLLYIFVSKRCLLGRANSRITKCNGIIRANFQTSSVSCFISYFHTGPSVRNWKHADKRQKIQTLLQLKQPKPSLL